MDQASPQERFQELLRDDRRYKPEAYNFVFEALDYTVRMKYGDPDDFDGDRPVHQHVSGPDLLEGIRQLALETFGCLAHTVFEQWGVDETADFGEIVFNLVEHGLMGSQESDRREDFHGGYEGLPFAQVFDVRPILDYAPDRDEWSADYESEAYG